MFLCIFSPEMNTNNIQFKLKLAFGNQITYCKISDSIPFQISDQKIPQLSYIFIISFAKRLLIKKFYDGNVLYVKREKR